MESLEGDCERFHCKDGHRDGVGVNTRHLFRIGADAAILEEQNPSDAQALQALIAFSRRIARRGRDRPRRSRSIIIVGNII